MMRRWNDLLSDEERAKVQAFKTKAEQSRVPTHITLLAEFATMYGWQAARDVMEDRISTETFIQMLKAGRHIHRKRRAELCTDMFNAFACTMTKNGDTKLQQIINKLEKE